MLRFNVQLEPTPSGAYLPGQHVKGTIILSCRKKIDFCKLDVKTKGSAKAAWTDYSSNSDGETIKIKESYFNNVVTLAGSKVNDKMELLPGNHDFPFSFTLPLAIPSSFEGKHGGVRYSVKAVMKRGLLKADYTNKIPFIVNTVADLSEDETAMVSVPREIIYQPIGAEIWLNRKGYVPGETILFNAKMENFFGMSEATALFIQETKFIDRKENNARTRIVRRTLWEKRTRNIPDNTTLVWDNIPIIVPQVPPSDALDFCGFIKISYHIELNIKLKNIYSNISLLLNVTIGSVSSSLFPDTQIPVNIHSASDTRMAESLINSVPALSSSSSRPPSPRSFTNGMGIHFPASVLCANSHAPSVGPSAPPPDVFPCNNAFVDVNHIERLIDEIAPMTARASLQPGSRSAINTNNVARIRSTSASPVPSAPPSHFSADYHDLIDINYIESPPMQTLQSSRYTSSRLTPNIPANFTSTTTFPTFRDTSALPSAGELPDYNTLVDANHIESPPPTYEHCQQVAFDYHETTDKT